MNISPKWLGLALALSLGFVASARADDVAYCTALSEKYQRYMDMNLGRSSQPQSLDTQVAIQKCGAGDAAASIPVLEKALKGARLDLPPRT